jgi:hypothetical protein
MSKTFRIEDMPFGIANGKSQIPNSRLHIPESGFWNLKFVVWNSNASEDRAVGHSRFQITDFKQDLAICNL